MRIGIYGGSFDPFHNGHLAMINSAIASGYVECCIVVPSVRNSFKRYSTTLPAPYRYYMTEHAVAGLAGDKVFVSDVEFGIEGVSYTVLMLERLTEENYISSFLQSKGVSKKRACEHHEFFWIMGSDTLATFQQWYKPAGILRFVTLLAAIRPGDNTDVHKESDLIASNLGGKVETFRLDGVMCSSSDINRRRDFTLCPESVREFIDLHALYNDNTALVGASDEARAKFFDVATAMYPYLKEKRLLHTLNVGILSAHFARVYGADIDKALIAGALHDCAKELDTDVQKKLANQYSDENWDDKKLYHSPGGATFAKTEFGIEDREILDAICYHTTGHGNMTLLEKIVYLADKIEPSRTYADLSDIRTAAETDLDEAVRMTAAIVVAKFERQGRQLHPLTLEMMRDLGL